MFYRLKLLIKKQIRMHQVSFDKILLSKNAVSSDFFHCVEKIENHIYAVLLFGKHDFAIPCMFFF